MTSSLKSYFGLANVTSDVDFVNALTVPLGSWQARNWDPSVGSKTFERFCESLTGNSTTSLALPINLELLPQWPSNPRKQLAAFSNYAAYIKEHVAAKCPEGVAQDECFGTDLYEGDGLEEAPWKSWAYQFCTGEIRFFVLFSPGRQTLLKNRSNPFQSGVISSALLLWVTTRSSRA